jgi:hypothetical protein
VLSVFLKIDESTDDFSVGFIMGRRGNDSTESRHDAGRSLDTLSGAAGTVLAVVISLLTEFRKDWVVVVDCRFELVVVVTMVEIDIL